MKSRNQREGKFIPGWCYNPAYKRQLDKKGNLVPTIRAGKHFELKRMSNPQLGNCFIRTFREGAYE